MGGDGPQHSGSDHLYLLCAIPLVCGYADLMCAHITLRILVIGTYLRKLETYQRTTLSDKFFVGYEQFAQLARTGDARVFALENWTMHGSTVLLSLVVAFWQTGTNLRGWDWRYPFAGLVGILIVVGIHSTHEFKRRALDAING
jgi:hypothetical protein